MLIKGYSFVVVFLLCFFVWNVIFLFALAQTVSLDPQTIEIEQGTNFSLDLDIESASDLFATGFDLDFDPSLVEFVSANEGSFLSQGCDTTLMVAEDPPGKLIIGLTRLGALCGGVSGSGSLMTLNFKTLDQAGVNDFSFSNNFLCILEEQDCNYITGTWTGSLVIITDSLAVCLVLDFDCNEVINAVDLTEFKAFWGSSDLTADFNQDSIVDAHDFGILMSQWTAEN